MKPANSPAESPHAGSATGTLPRARMSSAALVLVRADSASGVSPVSTSSISLCRISSASRPPCPDRGSRVQLGGLVVGRTRPEGGSSSSPQARSRRRFRRGWVQARSTRVCPVAMASASAAKLARVWELAAPSRAVALKPAGKWETSRPGSAASDRSTRLDPGGFRRRGVEPGAGRGVRERGWPRRTRAGCVRGPARPFPRHARRRSPRAARPGPGNREVFRLAIDDRAPQEP